MTEDDKCPRCGLEWEAVIELDRSSKENTVGIKLSDNKQMCVKRNSNGTWLYIHREGGGASGK